MPCDVQPFGRALTAFKLGFFTAKNESSEIQIFDCTRCVQILEIISLPICKACGEPGLK